MEYWVFQENIRRARSLVATHSQLHNKRGKPKTVVSDIMRAAVVLAVSAVDAYLHGVLGRYIASAAQTRPIPPALIALFGEWRLKPQTILEWTFREAGADGFRQHVESHFADRTLQDPSKVAHVFSILGIDDVWSRIATGISAPEEEVRRRFAAIVKRRHRIAHEADLDPGGKGPTKKTPLGRDTAASYCDTLSAIVAQMHNILEEEFGP